MQSSSNNYKKRSLAATFFLCAWWVLPSFSQEDYPIAGLQPERRPENAPAITTVDKHEAWYQQALTGLSAPYPESFKFLEDQGNWHTPFNQPGMTGRYDLRGWHQSPE